MSPATGPRIMIAIGILALGLTAITPVVSSAAEPVKQEKKAGKQAQGRTSAPAPQAPAKKFATAEIAGKSPSCFGEAPTLKGKRETRSP